MAEIKEKDENMKPEHVRFKKKSQVTVPHDIVEALNLKVGDDLQVRLENGKIVLVPMVSVPKDQAWFWTEQWQQEERSEEHTSELQSRFDLVCRLLLEKKKDTQDT